VHSKSTQVNASPLDLLLGINLELVVFKERAGRQARVRRDFLNTGSTQNGFDVKIKLGSHPAPRESRMSKKQVEVTVFGVGSESGEKALRFRHQGVKVGKALFPACRGGLIWRPRGTARASNRAAANSRIEAV
jgi:hypothetical protein